MTVGVADSYNFLRISDLVTSSGVVGPEGLAALGREGYDAVINLLPDDSEWAVADESEIVGRQGLAYVHIPVDFQAPTADDLAAFTAALDAFEGRRVHVHCAANFRVTAFYGLYAVARGTHAVAAADELAERFWDPADHPVWADFIAAQRRRIDGP